jgi:putative DNA primase/helicase
MTLRHDRDGLSEYLHEVFGDDSMGYVHVAAGIGGYFDDAGTYSFKADADRPDAKWVPRVYSWPDQADALAAALGSNVDAYDLYVCPYLMRGKKRTPSEALTLTKIHADIDGDCDLDKVADLGGWAVSSGTPGHAHVYVALAEPIPLHWHEALCRGLGTYLGHADAKIRPNDVLRPPGTLNHKSRARGHASSPVDWLIKPTGVRWDPAALAEHLGLSLPEEPGTDVVDEASVDVPNSSGPVPADGREGTAIDLADHPDIRRALADVSDPPDRSVDTMKVVAAVHDAGLSLPHARWAVGQRDDLSERLDGRRDDDIATCWSKISTDREQLTACGLGKRAIALPGHARFTDAGVAETVAAEVLTGKFLRARGIGWLQWDGARWRECGDGPPTEAIRKFVIKRIEQHAEKLKRDPFGTDESEAIEAWKKLGSASRIAAVLKLAGNIVEVQADQLDADPDLLNTPGGVVDLRTGEVSPHMPELYMTRITRGSFEPGYTHPDVDAVLEALPESERDWLQRRIGQAITGHMSSDVVLLQGGGENGKSALTTGGLYPALGDYAHTASSRLFSAEKSNDHSTERADLRGRRLVIGEELTEGRSLDVTAIKRMTDVDYITARRLYQDNTTFRASHTLIVNTNHRPVIDQTDHGTWRRLALLRFPYTFVKRREDMQRDTDRLGDPTLKQRVSTGHDGQHDALVTWAVIGAIAYYASPAEALIPTDQIADDTRQWRAETDRILGYWGDRLIPDQQGKIHVVDLLADFNLWLVRNGHREWSKENFGPRFEEHQETKRHNVVRSRIRNPDGLSHHGGYPPPSARKGSQWVWVGVRFQRPEDEIAPLFRGQSSPFNASDS